MSTNTLIVKEATDIPTTAPVKNVDESTTEMEFNRTNVEKLGTDIHLVDSDPDNKLDMFCYVNCNRENNYFLKQCRGVVFSGDNIVMKAFPYTSEYTTLDIDLIKNEIGNNFDKCIFYESHEGTLVRVFSHNDKWFISTHRKLNAFKSKWASRESFGSSFKKALETELEFNESFRNYLPNGDNVLDRFYSVLDAKKQYMFLIRNSKDNRIVCSAPDRPTVYHVGTFVGGLLVLPDNNENYLHIPSSNKILFTNVEEILEYVDKINYRQLQGIICFAPNNVQYKIVNKDYKDLYTVRGNEPSVKFRFLQVRLDRRYSNILYNLYPEFAEIFDDYENTIYDIARGIYRSYVQRFIKKRYVTVPREEFSVIRECHAWHLLDRTENRISLNQVINILNYQSPTHLNHMIRRFRIERLRKNEQTLKSRPRSESMSSSKSFEQSPVTRKINYNFSSLPPSPLQLPAQDTSENKPSYARVARIQ